VRITLDVLRQAVACEDQIRLFASLYPTGVDWPDADADRQRLVTEAARAGLDVPWAIERLRLDFTGLAEHYYANGQLAIRSRYRDGQLHAENDWAVEYYYANGKLLTRARYRDGKLHSDGELWAAEDYGSDGKLVSRARWHDGQFITTEVL